MRRSLSDDKPLDFERLAPTNRNVDAEKVKEARELIRILRGHGISAQGYELTPPFRRQVYVQSKHTEA